MPGPNKEMARVARNLIRENEDVRLTVKELEGRGVLGRRARLSHRAAAGLSWLHASLARLRPRSSKEPGARFRSKHRNHVRGTADRN
jgi:hypothetical protein